MDSVLRVLKGRSLSEWTTSEPPGDMGSIQGTKRSALIGGTNHATLLRIRFLREVACLLREFA